MGDVLKRVRHVPVARRIALIEDWVFSARDRRLVRDKLVDGMTYEELADKYHLCVKRCQDIVAAAVDAILLHY